MPARACRRLHGYTKEIRDTSYSQGAAEGVTVTNPHSEGPYAIGCSCNVMQLTLFCRDRAMR